MATAIWYPERGDAIWFKDGSVGAVVEIVRIDDSLESWIVKTRIKGIDGPMANVMYSSAQSYWKEVD